MVRGTGLLAADSGGTSDPYVLVSLWSPYDGGNSARSSAKKKTLNPVWEETLSTLSVYDAPDRCVISFSVWDHDNLSINDDIGRGAALPNPSPKPNPSQSPNPNPNPEQADLACVQMLLDAGYSLNLKEKPPNLRLWKVRSQY